MACHTCADSKHMFAFTSLLIPRMAKSWAGPGNEATHSYGAQVSEIWRSYAGVVRSVSCFIRAVSYSMKFIC